MANPDHIRRDSTCGPPASPRACSEPCADPALEEEGFRRLPSLFRIRDLRAVTDRRDDWRIRYIETTEDGTPLFAAYRRRQARAAGGLE